MKYLLALVLGIAVGAVITLALLYYNPFTTQASLSPLEVSERPQFSLQYSAIADHAIVYTNDGESRVRPYPDKVLQLWEAPVRRTAALVTLLRDGRGMPAGIGIKFSTHSEDSRILNGEALVDSVWHVWLPERGSFMLAQTENYWDYLREVVLPAYLSSGNNWKGNWRGTVTSGPGALGTAKVFGGSGSLAGVDAEAIETLAAKAYSSDHGPVAMEGQLTIELPVPGSGLAADNGSD